MLTFGDSVTEQSSMEEKKKQTKGFSKKKKHENKNNQNEFTRESDGQEAQSKVQSYTQSEQVTVEVVIDNNNISNNKNTSKQSVIDQDGNLSNNEDVNHNRNNYQNENQENSDKIESMAFKIMSPKGLKQQIQLINLDKSQGQHKSASKQNIFQIEEQNNQSQHKHSNMIATQAPFVQQNQNATLIFDEFNNAENVVKLFIVQILLAFEILSAILVKSFIVKDEIEDILIIGMGVQFIVGVFSIIIIKIKKLEKIQKYILILLRLASIIIYVECRVIVMFSAYEKSVDIYMNKQVQDIIKVAIYDKSQINNQRGFKYQIPSHRFLLIQAIYIGTILIILAMQLYKSLNFHKSITKNITLILMIIYIQIRLQNYEYSCLIYSGIVSIIIFIILILFKFQNSIIFTFCLTSNSKLLFFDMENKTLSNQINNTNQNHNHILSPRFGAIQTNHQNDANQDKFFSNKQTNGLLNKNTLIINKQNQQLSIVQQPNENIIIKGQQDNNLFSPKNFLINESLQYITPRDELDSKREIDIEQAKPDFINNNNNNNNNKNYNQQAVFSPQSDRNQNQNIDQKYPSFQQPQYSSKNQDSAINNNYQNDIEPNETSMRKTLECVGELENEDGENDEGLEYQESENIQESDKPDANLYEGDRSDTVRESVNTSRAIIPTQVQNIENLSQKNKEEKEKQKILKQAREAFKIRRKLAEQQNKQKTMRNKNGVDDQVIELQNRLLMQDMILNNVSSGIVVVQKETNEVIYVNRQACQNLNCSVDKIFQTLMSLRNIFTLKDELNNFSEILQQFDSPIELSQLSTMRGLFLNHEKLKEVMICIQSNSGLNNSFSGSQNNFPSSSDTASFSQKDWESVQQQNKMKKQIQNKIIDNKSIANNNSFSIKNYLDTNTFLQIEVDLIKREGEKFVIFSINNINWNNPLNIIHTTTLKVQYFIRKMISELSIDMNDIREYFLNMSNSPSQKIDYNGCIGKIDCMTEFLQDFATSSLLISGTFIPIKQQMNLIQLIQNVIDKVKQRTSSKQYLFNITYDSLCPQNIFSDSKRLDRVFYNLLLYFIDTNERAQIAIRIQPNISTINNNKKKLKVIIQILQIDLIKLIFLNLKQIMISCTTKYDDDDENEQNTEISHADKKIEGRKKNEGIQFSLAQKKAQITNVYMLENMHYGVLLSNSIIQKLEPEEQGIYFQSGQQVCFSFQLSIQ